MQKHTIVLLQDRFILLESSHLENVKPFFFW